MHIFLDHYYNNAYDNKERFCSYWHQIDEINKLNVQNVLEIGIGNGFVSEYLKKRNLNVITADINKDLKPDVVGNIIDMPFKTNFIEAIVCYEVLEHLPYANFTKVLLEIYRVTKDYAIISLPDVNPTFRLFIQIPKIGEIKTYIPIKRFIKSIHRLGGDHYWEIGKSGYSLKKILQDIHTSGFMIEKTYRVFEYPYHRFFILKKKVNFNLSHD